MADWKKFSKFSLIWYSQQFAIPFWIIGHVHLHLNDYHDIIELSSSAIMHFMVALGFWLDWQDYNKGE
mgnify:FL=1|tara:strand:- start:382 stop:585 length:204 start_codon:yes stop_codon:yes gene_type:complete